jgi:hypothetical protein
MGLLKSRRRPKGRMVCGAGASQTMTTIVPNCSLFSRYRCTSTISSNSNVRSMIGMSAPFASPLTMYSTRPLRVSHHPLFARQYIVLFDQQISDAVPQGTGYDEALGRAETESYQRFVARFSSGEGRLIAFVAKSIVTRAVMSATEKRSPATNGTLANRASRSE